MRHSRTSLHCLLYTISVVVASVVFAFLRRDALVKTDYAFRSWKVIISQANKNRTDQYHFSALQNGTSEEPADRRYQSTYYPQSSMEKMSEVTYVPQTVFPTVIAQNWSVNSLIRWDYEKKKKNIPIFRATAKPRFFPRVSPRMVVSHQYLLSKNNSYRESYQRNINPVRLSAGMHEHHFSHLMTE